MSKIEVNQISSQCGSTLTVGQSGDTVTLAAGATQTGFGRTGTVDWDTTAKTASFTAVSGNGYFVNTTSGAITLTLPASPSAGDIVAFKDYAFTFATNNLTVNGNGSPIGGVDGTVNPTYNTNGTSKTFIYVDGTKGWLVTNESTDTSQEVNPAYIVATGGTVTCCGDFKIHTFTGPGTFTVCSVGNPAGSNSVDYLVVAGGGGGVSTPGVGGGSGAGGFRLSNSTCMPAPLTSPLANTTGITVTATAFPITVGSGGSTDSNGSNSVFSTITSTGGGGGKGSPNGVGNPGGSGSGGRGSPGNPVPADGFAGGAGNTPPVSPPQGNPGGFGTDGVSCFTAGGGGGGAGAAGSRNPPSPGAAGPAGPGGIGSYVVSAGFAGCNGESGPVCGARYFAGGGGGAVNGFTGGTNIGGSGGIGGGGDGSSNCSPGCSQNGTANTGGGAGGSECSNTVSRTGGSGIVVIRYKFQ